MSLGDLAINLLGCSFIIIGIMTTLIKVFDIICWYDSFEEWIVEDNKLILFYIGLIIFGFYLIDLSSIGK